MRDSMLLVCLVFISIGFTFVSCLLALMCLIVYACIWICACVCGMHGVRTSWVVKGRKCYCHIALFKQEVKKTDSKYFLD